MLCYFPLALGDRKERFETCYLHSHVEHLSLMHIKRVCPVFVVRSDIDTLKVN
jgi:hypothetical protein